MKSPKRLLALGFPAMLMLALPQRTTHAQDQVPSSPVTVQGTRITFDPKTCREGKGQFFWGLGSCAVTILGPKGNHCRFEYLEEVEMGSALSEVLVPLDSGPVTIQIQTITSGKSSYEWPVTSFPLDQATLIRSSGPTGTTVRIAGTREYLTLPRGEEARSEMRPRKGRTARFRFEFYEDAQCEKPLTGAAFRPTEDFVMGSDEVWPWMNLVAETMTVGDRQRVELPATAAEGASKWLPAGFAGKVLHVQVNLLAVGPEE